MTEYRHGGDVYRNRNIVLDFSVNVNPLGMPDFIREAAVRGVSLSYRYPDSECGRLKALTADFYKVPEDGILFGNGAAELIYGIVQALHPKKAVLLAPSFTEYEKALEAAGAEISFFYLKEENEFRLPADEYMAFLLREGPDMVFLCNPANPVGSLTGREEINKIIDFCAEHGIFAVLDECFLDFCREGEAVSALTRIREGYENLFVIRAFTKSFAMAGLRLGYGFLLNRALLKRMRARIQPWNVSIPAQEAGCAAFGPERKAYLSGARVVIETEREYLKEGLMKAGLLVFSSDANFLLFKDDTGRPARALYDFFLGRGILIRCCDDYKGLGGRYYRICVKCREDNRKLLSVFGENI